jgi:hypothetical protein
MADITHEFVTALPDGADATQVQGTAWNDPHVVSGGFEKVSSNDTTYGYLNGKLVAGTNVTLTENNDGGNETLTITAAAAGSSGIVTSGAEDSKFESPRDTLRDSTGVGSYLYLGEDGSAEIAANDEELWLSAYGTEPIVMYSEQGVVVPSDTLPPDDVFDDGHTYVDSGDGAMHFLRMAQPDLQFSPDLWYHQGFPATGFGPSAFPIGFVQNGVYTTARNLPANGGSIAIPFYLPAPMNITRQAFWGTDTSLAREWMVALYHQPFNRTGSNVLGKIPGSTQYGSTTPSAVGLRNVSMSSTECICPAGMVWLVIHNTHATNTLGIGYMAGSTQMPVNLAQTKTLTLWAPEDDTLDFTAASWTKVTDIHSAVIGGRVFNNALF